MYKIYRSHDRGTTKLAWLQSQHHFSFGQYLNHQQMGLSDLRVFNEDHVSPGAGFALHSHTNMEILSYVISGSMRHQDTLGNEEFIHCGDFQLMSAGRGISHSEYNASEKEYLHFLQIWIQPAVANTEPSYQQFNKNPVGNSGLQLVASEDGRLGSMQIKQSTDIYFAKLSSAEIIQHTLPCPRNYFLHVIIGDVTVNRQHLEPGDALSFNGESGCLELSLSSMNGAEILLFDLRETT